MYKKYNNDKLKVLEGLCAELFVGQQQWLQAEFVVR